jgi:hypothetical protein
MRTADKMDREVVPSVNGANVSVGGNVPTDPDGRVPEYAVGQFGWHRFDTICGHRDVRPSEHRDRDEAEAQVSERPSLTSAQIAASLRDLQSLFADAEPATQHRIVAALFEQVEVLGPSEVWLYPTIEAEARGWATAMEGEFRVESTNGRGERTRADTLSAKIE